MSEYECCCDVCRGIAEPTPSEAVEVEDLLCDGCGKENLALIGTEDGYYCHGCFDRAEKRQRSAIAAKAEGARISYREISCVECFLPVAKLPALLCCPTCGGTLEVTP